MGSHVRCCLRILAAKEEAFQESIKLRNQFRNLDEDEVEFLDSVLESTRKKEEEVKKETSEQLDLFRRQQEEKDKELLEGGEETDGKAGSPIIAESQSAWVVNARKRKRIKENERAGLKGLKLRKSSSAGEPSVGLKSSSSASEVLNIAKKKPSLTETAKPPGSDLGTSLTNKAGGGDSASTLAPAPSKAVSTKDSPKQETISASKPPDASVLGLAGYSSDEDD